MSRNKITLYVDIISPFGYLAYWLFRNSRVFRDIELELVPIVLGGLHKKCNNTAPIFIKNKSVWINKERTRWADQFGIPIRPTAPRTFPVSTVNALRALVALQAELAGKDGADETLAQVLDLYWAALWNPDAVPAADLQALRDEGGKGEFDVKNTDTLAKLMGAVDGVGEDLAKKVIGSIGEKAVKDQLAANTERAFQAGAFGLPWFECTNANGDTDGFWGFDHLGVVCRFLGLEGSLEADDPQSKKGVRAML